MVRTLRLGMVRVTWRFGVWLGMRGYGKAF